MTRDSYVTVADRNSRPIPGQVFTLDQVIKSFNDCEAKSAAIVRDWYIYYVDRFEQQERQIDPVFKPFRLSASLVSDRNARWCSGRIKTSLAVVFGPGLFVTKNSFYFLVGPGRMIGDYDRFHFDLVRNGRVQE